MPHPCLSPVTWLTGSLGSSCLWLNPGNEWSTGKKLYMVIPMDQAHEGWSIRLNFTTPITSLESWKGTVEERAPSDGTLWRITNKCYNSHLYACQCLELGFIVRYPSYSDPSFLLDFNSQRLDICPEEPVCLKGDETTPTVAAPLQLYHLFAAWYTYTTTVAPSVYYSYTICLLHDM